MTAKISKPHSDSFETAATNSEDDFVRLHITPLDANLLNIVVPRALQSLARNISYHSLETFPERRYGFVELPRTEADKLRKKLNGAMLKGAKMRIEPARPDKKDATLDDGASSESKTRKRKTKAKDKEAEDLPTETPIKRKRDYGVIEGVALDDRKVKRGWTEPADFSRKKSRKDKTDKNSSQEKEKDRKRKQVKSKYTEKEECLFKTRLPPNSTVDVPAEEKEAAKKRKRKQNTQDVVVHEFERTTKFPSFLKASAPSEHSKEAHEFVEGKGWVDAEGNLIEAVVSKATLKPQRKKAKASQPVESASSEDDSTSSSGSSSEDESDEPVVKNDLSKGKATDRPYSESSSESATSSSESDSSDSSSSSSESEDGTPVPSNKDPISSELGGRDLKIAIPSSTPEIQSVHPLEALYKRQKANGAVSPSRASESQAFSFFGGNVDDEDIEIDEDIPATSLVVPMTPYTKQDFEWRNIRSAAPTPDTVHPSRMHAPWADEDEAMEGEDEEEEEDAVDGEQLAESGEQETSDFQKWFWENRRELNRSWMTRRKTAAKEKRHRDNKARASRAV